MRIGGHINNMCRGSLYKNSKCDSVSVSVCAMLCEHKTWHKCQPTNPHLSSGPQWLWTWWTLAFSVFVKWKLLCCETHKSQHFPLHTQRKPMLFKSTITSGMRDGDLYRVAHTEHHGRAKSYRNFREDAYFSSTESYVARPAWQGQS